MLGGVCSMKRLFACGLYLRPCICWCPAGQPDRDLSLLLGRNALGAKERKQDCSGTRRDMSKREEQRRPTLSGFRLRISTIFLPDSCPTLSPDPSDLVQPVDSDPSVLRKVSSSFSHQYLKRDGKGRKEGRKRCTSAVMLTISGLSV